MPKAAIGVPNLCDYRSKIERCSNVGNRPALNEMLSFIREGDDVYVHSMDRLARNLRDLLSLVEQINGKGVTLHFVTENLSFQSNAEANPMATLMLSLLGAVAQFERSLILVCHREGIAKAKARGSYKGRKPVNPELLEKAKVMRAGLEPGRQNSLYN